jgi:hypothetical protein
MTGIEVVALVVAIISSFTTVASYFQNHKKQKKEQRRRRHEAKRLRRSLALGPPQVQGEYDYDFARLGQQFAVGDGPYILPLLCSRFWAYFI